MDNGFKGTDMARTLYVEHFLGYTPTGGLRILNFTFIFNYDDDTLNGIVRSVKEELPNSGYRMVWGHLKRRGLHGYSAVPC